MIRAFGLKQLRWRLIFGAVMVVGCSEKPSTQTSDSNSPANPRPAVPARVLTGNRVAGIRFDPTAVATGTKLGAMTLDSIAVRTAFDSTRVGTAWFSGSVELSGAKLRHFDSDVDALCFEADSASAARLPRWEGDERRSWFCFSNRRAAQAVLGPPGDSARATVVIDRLTIHRGMSDEVNSARFVRALTK
jgi:hypothetical protein